MSNTLDKKFYSYIPKYMEDKLEMKILLYGKEPWFAEAWQNYASHCHMTPLRQIIDPDTFFDEFEAKYKKSAPVDIPKEELKQTEDDGMAFADISDGVAFSEPLSKAHAPSEEEKLDIFTADAIGTVEGGVYNAKDSAVVDGVLEIGNHKKKHRHN